MLHLPQVLHLVHWRLLGEVPAMVAISFWLALVLLWIFVVGCLLLFEAIKNFKLFEAIQEEVRQIEVMRVDVDLHYCDGSFRFHCQVANVTELIVTQQLTPAHDCAISLFELQKVCELVHLKGHLFGYGVILWSRAQNFCALV
jgi:hypothetical protein